MNMGSNGYVKVPGFALGNTSTIATWIKADFNRPVDILARDGMNTVFSTRPRTASPSGALLFVNYWNTQNRGAVFESGNSSTYQQMRIPAGSVENNTWQHLALTINRTTDTVEFYIDGTKLTSSGSFLETFTDNGAMFIGSPGSDTNWWHFDGKIDDFRVYDSVLTSSEIRSLVPEPATFSLLTFGGLCLLRKRKA